MTKLFTRRSNDIIKQDVQRFIDRVDNSLTIVDANITDSENVIKRHQEILTGLRAERASLAAQKAALQKV